jgi:hypothetical protein
MTVASFSPILHIWPDGSYRTDPVPSGLFALSAPFVNGNRIAIQSPVIDFGSKTQQSPLIWDNFSSGTDGQLLTAYDPTWQAYNGTAGALIGQGANARYSGGKFAYNTSTRGEFFTNFKTLGASRTRFLSYWWRTADLEINSTDQGVLKMCRLTSSAAIGGGGVYNGRGAHYLSALIPQNDGAPFMGYYNSAGSDTTNFGPGGSNAYIELPINEWCRIDMFVSMSHVNTPDGIFSCSVLGGPSYSRNDLIQNVSGQPELMLDSIILGLMQANHVGTYSQMIHGVFMDDTPARFEVGLSESYATNVANGTLENQAYEIWSGGRVDVIANTAVYGPGVDKFLFYTDNNGSVNDGTNTGFYLGNA